MGWKFRLSEVFRFTISSLICGLMILALYSPVNADHNSKPLMLPSSWTVLPDGGLDYTVYTIFPVGTDVYVGGAFTTSAGGASSKSECNCPARYSDQYLASSLQ